jgi:hypothetical protein
MVHFVDVSVIVDRHCLEVMVHFVDVSVIVDRHCLEVMVHFVDVSVILDFETPAFVFSSDRFIDIDF